MKKIVYTLIVLSALMFYLDSDRNKFAFSQMGDQIGSSPELGSFSSDNLTTIDPLTSNQSFGSSQQPLGFVAQGTINTLITVPAGKWLATGDWEIILNNGEITSFNTNTTWLNSSGTNSHSHELTNFRILPAEGQSLPLNLTDKSITLKGITDVGTNDAISWFEVPTTISFNDRKIINISVDDTKTNGHFGGQPLLGIVDSFVQCSDVPGANMELLPPCSIDTIGEEELGLTNDSLGFANDALAYPPHDQFAPFEGQPGGEFQGMPGGEFQGMPGGEFQGMPGGEFQGMPGGEFQGMPGGEFQGMPGGEFQPEDDQPGDADQRGEDDDQPGVEFPPGGAQPVEVDLDPNCTDLDIRNITASGFETDPSDYHPPKDAIDGDSSTWWSHNENDPWVTIDLGQPSPICAVSVEWNKGDTRDYSFEVEVSEDGNEYEKVFEGNNNKGSSQEEIYQVEDTDVRYIKLIITDTSSGDGWVSIQEVKVIGLPII